jgi:uncharacterized protein (TIGR03032 family)
MARDASKGLKSSPPMDELTALWSEHESTWRDPASVIDHWDEYTDVDPRLLQFRVQGAWWDILATTQSTLIVTREYENLVLAIRAANDQPEFSYLRVPHPSGIAIDRQRQVIYLACTRNPNQVRVLAPANKLLPRLDMSMPQAVDPVLVPVESWFLPGSTYLHDLAMIGGKLYGNSVGQNAVVHIDGGGRAELVWWPRCIERPDGPIFGRNHLQLNSIAAGENLERSYFSASTDHVSARRPGHRNFPVDRRGVIFSGASREPVACGLTRPHSTRLYNGDLWVDNSGYGELVVIKQEKPVLVARLPGWTRGLCFHGNVAFVATSRVIPRFRQYAPGLDVEHSVCGLHAVDIRTGKIVGSLTWPYGYQIFSAELVSDDIAVGFPFEALHHRDHTFEKQLFYAFNIDKQRERNI